MKILRFFSILIIFSISSPIFSREVNDSGVNTTSIAPGIYRVNNADVEITLPNYIFSNSNTKIAVRFKDATNIKLTENNQKLSFIVNGTDMLLTFDEKGQAFINYAFKPGEDLSIYFEDFRYVSNIRVIPIWYVIGPIGLIVILLGYRMIKGKKKLNNNLAVPVEKEKENHTWTADAKKEESRLNIKEVVEEEEEIFS